MKSLKVPSLQHLARNWSENPNEIAKKLVHVAEHPPTFSYQPLHDLVRDSLVFKLPLQALTTAVDRKISRDSVKNNYLEILKLVHSHFESAAPTFVAEVGGRIYPIGRELFVPFTPPLAYGAEGVLFFPWFSFWRSNQLAGENLSLFVTLVYEMLAQDPDLEEAKFQILDFSVPKGNETRKLVVIDAQSIERVSESRKIAMLEVFAQGFWLAKNILEKNDTKQEQRPSQNVRDTFTAELFPD